MKAAEAGGDENQARLAREALAKAKKSEGAADQAAPAKKEAPADFEEEE